MHTTSSYPATAPSPWILRWTPLVPAGAPVLDVACGRGRHMKWFAEHGHAVTGVDRDPASIAAVSHLGEAVLADIENGPWPLAGRQFGAVIVTNYLWRPLLPTLLDGVAEGGVLVYETFSAGNESVGKPSRPDFLLQPGELLQVCAGPQWRIVAFEDGFLADPPRFVQRIATVKQPTATARENRAAEQYPL
ncbi:MAG: class I SAM-dependent methyltransferase [Comamonadaceae bacterium]|nr:class I SAM-dependent methyltransferase [Comamonadaceae bacterium]